MPAYDNDVQLTVGLEPGNVVNTAEQINAEIEQVFENAKGIDVSQRFKSLQVQLDQARTRSQQLLDKMNELKGVEFTTDAYQQVLDTLTNTENQINTNIDKIKELTAQQKELAKQRIPSKEYTDLQNQITKSETALAKLNNKMDRFVATGGKKNSRTFSGMEYDAKQLQASISNLKSQVSDLLDTGKAFSLGSETQEYKNLTEQTAALRAENDELEQSYLNALTAKQQLEESGQDIVKGEETQEYYNLAESLNNVNNKAKLLYEKLLMLNELPPPARVAAAFGILASAIGRAALSAIKFVGSHALQLIQTGLSKIANLAKKAASNLVKMASNTVIGGLKNLGKAISGVSKHSSRNNSILDKGFKTFIKYAFGVRSFFFLFRKIRSAIIDGFGDLAQVHEPFNAAMSSIMTSLGYLRNSFASAFAPIIETVAPALTTFINLVASAVSQIGMLIAALTGKEFVMAIPVQKNYAASVGNTADNASKASKATADQNKKAKELKRTLAGFDDVEILQEDKDTDTSSPNSGGGGGGGAGAGGLGFTTSTISGAIKDFAAKLLEAWKKGDFTEIGKIVGEKLRDALERIPWTKIKKTLRKIAKVIATFLNGFLEVPGLFYTIGKTLAEGLNSAFEFLNSFIQNFHWDSFGKALRDGILGITNNLDWSVISATFRNLGRGVADFINAGFTDPEVWTGIFTTIGHAINVVLYGIQQLIHNTDWENLVSSIGTGLSNGFNMINWPAIGDIFISAINGVINLAYKFVTEFDFKEFGNSVGTGISNAINNIEWDKGALTVAGAINGLFETLNGFIEEVDWKELGSTVVTTIATFFGELDWAEFSEFISNCFQALFEFFTGVISGINWDEVPSKILTAISEFLSGFEWDETAEKVGELIRVAFEAIIAVGSTLWNALTKVGENIIAGGLQGIDDALMNISDWIIEHIFNPFIKGFESAFDEHSPSKKMIPHGENIIAGMLQGILNPMSTITSWINQHIFKPITGGVSSLFGIGKNNSSFNNIGNSLVTDLQSGISNTTGHMSGWISSNMTNKINGFVTSSWGINGSSSSTFNSFGTSLIGGLQNGLTTAAHASQAWLRNSVTSTMSNYFKNLLGIGKSGGVFNKFGVSMMGDLKNGIHRNFNSVTSTLSSLRTRMVNIFSNYSWSSIGNNIAVGLYNGIVRNWNWLVNTVHNLAVSMYNAAVNALDIGSPSKKFAWIGDMTTAGWANGLTTTGDRVLNAMSNITDGLIEEAENANPALALDGSLSNLDSSVDTVLSDFSDKVVNEFSMLISTLERLSSSLQLAVPGIVLGQIAPYSLNGSSNSNANTISKLLEVIQVLTANQITRDDLQEIIDAIDNKDLDVHLGDEQVARSANRGNKKLNRRYNPVVL